MLVHSFRQTCFFFISNQLNFKPSIQVEDQPQHSVKAESIYYFLLSPGVEAIKLKSPSSSQLVISAGKMKLVRL